MQRDRRAGARTMPKRNMNEDDPLEDFEPRQIALDGVTKKVHVAGRGPAVIVMTEMPGISPQVARFSRWVRDAGFTAYMPSLFGRDGAVPKVEEGMAVFQRALHRASASRQRGQSRPTAVLRTRGGLPAQRGDRPPDRRSRPADDRRARRDTGVLRPSARCVI